jgi:hypothetical protein
MKYEKKKLIKNLLLNRRFFIFDICKLITGLFTEINL